MTTTFPVDNRTIVNQCDLETDWTATITVSPFTSAPAPIEASTCLGMVVSNTTQDAYDAITSDDWSNGTLSVWMRPFGAMDTQVNGGVGIQIGDGTNREAYHVGGSDKSGFRHEEGPHEWTCFLLDPGNKPANSSNLAGTEANLDESAITQVGVYFETIVKSVGGGTNCYWDIIRWANPGDDVVMQGGTTSGAAGNAEEAAAVDRSTGDGQAYGVIRELGAGVYGIQGNLTIGNSASASDQYWKETNVTYTWEDRGLSSTNYYRFKIIGSSTATNCEADFTSTTFVVPTAASAHFEGNGADLTVCNLLNCAIIGFDQGVETSGLSGSNWSGSSYIGCGQVVENGCDITGGIISGSVVAADIGSLLFNRTVDPDGDLDDMSFTMGAASHHAIDFGTNVDSSLVSITLRGQAFNGFGATDDADDSTLRFLATTGTLTVNLIDCTVDGVSPVASGGGKNFSVDDAAGMTVTVVVAPVTLAITVKDADTLLAIQNVQTSIHLKDSPFTQLMNEDTTAGGLASESYAGSTPVDIVWRCRKSDDLDNPRYIGRSGIDTVSASGLTLTILLKANPFI